MLQDHKLIFDSEKGQKKEEKKCRDQKAEQLEARTMCLDIGHTVGNLCLLCPLNV